MSEELTGARLSSAVVCRRLAAYQALGVEGEPYSLEVEQRFGRGRRIGKAMAEEVIASLAAKGREAVAEMEVPWGVPESPNHPLPFTGHADVVELDPSDDSPLRVIEVVSTEGCSLPPNKPKQAAAYAIFLEVDEAVVLSVDPKTGGDRVYPVNVEAFREEIEGMEDEVSAVLYGGPLPERFNGAHPGAYPCSDCPFLVGCMSDYTPPPAGRLPGHEDDLLRLVDIERTIKMTPRGDHVLELEAERDEIRKKIAGKMEPGMDYIENGVKIRRTEVNGRRSFSFSAAEASGFVIPDSLMAFVTSGKGHDKWTVREIGDGA